jgi:hypothetical protein
MRNPTGKSLVKMFALVLGIICAQSAPAQSFKRVNVKGGAPLGQIAAGGASVWALTNTGHPYIFKTNKFILANTISLTQIAVGGGNALQADAVWGLDSSGNIYTASRSGTTWVFSQAPGVLQFIAVGAGYNDSCHPYEVWGLYASSIYRFNYCIGNWDFVPGSLASLSAGSGEVWGLNGNGDIFRFDFVTLSFLQVTARFGPYAQITVGTNAVFVNRPGNTAVLGVTQAGQILVGGSLIQVQAGGDGVWGIGSSQQIFRLQPFTSNFVQIPGALVSISVGSGGGVWGLDSSGKAYGFTTP